MPFLKGHKGFGTPDSYKLRAKKISIALSGKPLSEAHKKKLSFAKLGKKQSPDLVAKRIVRGAKHWAWKGGVSHYPVDWTITLKRSIRERDRYTCQSCGEQQGEKAFSVHHIDRDKNNCSPDNLITLCQSCHMKWHIASISKAQQG